MKEINTNQVYFNNPQIPQINTAKEILAIK
jgi:hypothetical protein